MKYLMFALLLLTLPSCRGQSENQPPAVFGDTVRALANDVMVVYQDRKNNYWFGSWEAGLYRYDGTTMLHFTTKHGLSSHRVNEIREDAQGNLFVGTGAGVDKFDGTSFTAIPLVEGSEWKLEDDDVWFKSCGGGYHVGRLHGDTLYGLTFPENPLQAKFDSLFPGTALRPDDVYCVYRDRQGFVWFGTAAAGACRFDGSTLDWIQETDVTELHNGPSNGVRSIIEDKNGDFWFNSMYRYRVRGGGSTVETFGYVREKSIGNLDGKASGDLHEYLSIAKGDDGNLWFATYNDGVWRYDGTKVAHYDMKTVLGSMHTFYVYRDNRGDIWLGTHDSGVYKFTGERFERFKP